MRDGVKESGNGVCVCERDRDKDTQRERVEGSNGEV